VAKAYAPDKWTSATIRSMREERNLSLEEMAHQLGVSVTTLWKWEHGKQRPTGLSVRRLDEIASKVGT
jgi:DNA-binding transcriptional regulator YiaG